MAKKKVSPTQSQSNDHKSLPPPTIDHPSIQIQNLKNLNSVLLKETTHHRHQIESLLNSKNALHSALQTSTMDAETLNLTSELEKCVFFVYTANQMTEMGSRFFTLVGESNKRQHEVSVLKEQVNDLTLCLENEKLLLRTVMEERDQMKEEAENRERKAIEEVEKMRFENESLLEIKREKEKMIEELHYDSVLAVRNSRELEVVIEELKEKIDAIAREKNEAEMLNTTQGTKIFQLELEVKHLTELLKNSRDEETLMRGKILELEVSLGFALEKEEDATLKNMELLMEKKETEKTIEILTEKRDAISRVLDMAQRELENKQHELDEVNRAKEEIEKVRDIHENDVVELQGEIVRLKSVLDTLKEKCREHEENKEQLLSQVHHYKNSVDELNLEKENIIKELDEEKSKVKNLELHVVEVEKKNKQLLSRVQHYTNAVDEMKLEKDTIEKGFQEEKNMVESLKFKVVEMEGKIDQTEAELGQMIIEKEKINERNKELEINVDVLVSKKDALERNLELAKQECDDLRANFESASINSKQTLEMLRSTSGVLSRDSEEEVETNGKKKHEVEIKPYAEELDAIKKAFKVKKEMVDDMKKQLVSLEKSVAEANKGKSLWTGISSATGILAAALTAYIARGR